MKRSFIVYTLQQTRLKWARHVAQMGGSKNVHNILVGKSKSKTLF
jgi:hypothetical protein